MNLAEPGPHTPAAPTAALPTLQPPCSPRGPRLTGGGHAEETLDIQMRGQCCRLPEGPVDMRLAGGKGRGEAWLCVQTRPWASRKQVLAPRAGAASQLQLHSLGVASPGGCGQACQAETRHAPAPPLPSAPGWVAGLGGLLVGERKQRCDYRSRWEALPEKIPTTTHALDRKRGSGRFP